MAKKEIIWSLRAQQDRLEILEYWINHNKSTLYSEKLHKLFNEATKLISEQPNLLANNCFAKCVGQVY